MGSEDDRAGMARYGINVNDAYGVSVNHLRRMAKRLGQDHELALELWETGNHEARLLAAMVDDPAEVTDDQLEAWVADFDSWDVCDQTCCNLVDRTPLAWRKARDWSAREGEFVKRAGFAVMAGLAWHNKEARDDEFLALLPLILREATDERNYVKKAVNWALRNIGKRNRALNRAALDLADRLARADARSARWIGRDAFRELISDKVQARLKT